MRANDGSFAALLLIEGLDEAAVRDALHHARKTLPAEDHGAIDALPLYIGWRSACRSGSCRAESAQFRFAGSSCPAPHHISATNKGGILPHCSNRLNIGPFVRSLGCVAKKEEHDHGDNDAEGFGEPRAAARARRNDTERSSRYRRVC